MNGIRFELPVPGAHNVVNALAAIATCRLLGVELEDMTAPLAGFSGIGRRFQTVGKSRGIEVIDDFAHNADKIAAAIRTAKLRAKRVLAIYQPHGYGPTRFLRRDFVATFARELGAEDRLWMLEVFYAGGTATRDFSAADIVAEIARARRRSRVRPVAGNAGGAGRGRGKAGRSGVGDGRARPLAQRAGAHHPGCAGKVRNRGGEVAPAVSCRTGPEWS